MILYLQSAAPGASRFTVVNDGASVTGYDLLQGSTFGSPVWEHTYSAPRGTQGARASQGRLPNREIGLMIRVAGSTKDDLAAKLSDLADVVDDLRRFGGLCRWRSRSQTRFQSGDVLTASLDLPTWDNRVEQRARGLVMVRLVCGPYLLGDPMDLYEDFTTDEVNAGDAIYTADAGALTNLAVADGALAGAANLTTENRLIHTGTGYTLGDAEAQVTWHPGATITSVKVGVILKRIDASNYLEVYVDDNGANSRLRIDKVVAGARTNLSSTNLGARVVNGELLTVRGRLEENVVYAGFGSGMHTFVSAVSTTTATVGLTSAEIAAFGIGVSGRYGLVVTPQSTGAQVHQLIVRPFIRGTDDATRSDVAMLRGTIPGDAPAIADLWMRNPSPNPLPQGFVAWAPRVARNLVQNGAFDLNAYTVTPWQVSAVAGVTGAATSITSSSSLSRFGRGAGSISTPATANVGATYPIYQRFRRGITYTARAWVRSQASTTNVRIRLGVSGDISSSTAVALSPTWTLHTVTWTPTATVGLAYLAVEQTAATASTILASGCAVYEGTVAPTTGRHIEGAGGHPSLAVVAGADFVSKTANLAIAADGNAESGYTLRDTSVAAGGESYQATYIVDPSLLGPDDYSGDELALEVYGRLRFDNAFTGGATVTLSTQSISGTTTVGYTTEYGSAGKAIPVPLNDGYQTLRLGTVALSAGPSALWQLCLDVVVAAGTNLQEFGIDCLYLVPARSRALTPTAKAATVTTYPFVFPVAGGSTKIISGADLSGRLVHGTPDSVGIRSGGMGGSLIEIAPGDVDLLCFAAGEVIDFGGSESEHYQPRCHLAVTPRWHWMRDA